MSFRGIRPLAVGLIGLLGVFGAPVRAAKVALVADGELAAPAQHGLAKLVQALDAKGVSVVRGGVTAADADFVVLAGVGSDAGWAERTLRATGVTLPRKPEALVIHRTKIEGKPGLVLSGADDRGVMYAALEVADRVTWNRDERNPFALVREAAESPYVSERAVSIYTMQRAYFEQRLYDEEYWKRYFDLLARSRINCFVVIFGYENGGFMAPLYPYFFNVEGFPDVELVGLTPARQRRNVAAFRRMMEIAHERGVDFVPAPWDHIYRGGVQGGGIAGASAKAGQRTPGLVWGVTTENVAAYNKAAIRRFLEVFPEIDGIQFRMHAESGLRNEEMAAFWHEVFTMIKRVRPELRVDLRAKQLPDAIILDAVDLGLRVRIATKYWMEQQGLPFHPTHINRQNQHDRRHGYADLLRYPQRYKVHWRMWSGGTTRLLLWADPEYVRRFASSAKVYGGDSFEVNEMLATKMLGEPHDEKPLPIHTSRYRYYRYEFERYWHYFQVWGRVGYNPAVPAETWEWEFRRRFGEQAGTPLMQGLHLASRVLPRIVASSYRYQLFPTTRGWAGMMRIGDLPEYSSEQGSDIQQFMNLSDAARSIIRGTETAMRRPEANSDWFATISRQILKQVAVAESAAGEAPGREFLTTVTDLKILAHLAAYHAERLHAGLQYNLYRQTGDVFALDEAIRRERRAIGAWERIVEAAADVYSPRLAFGVHRVGFPRHWKEELMKLREGLKGLTAERRQARRPWSGGAAPAIAHVPIRRLVPGERLVIRATVASNTPLREVRALVKRGDGEYRPVPLRMVEEGLYRGEADGAEEEASIAYLIEAVDDGGTRATYPPRGKQAPVRVEVTSDSRPPVVEVEAPAEAKPGRGVTVGARAEDASGVRWVRLRYRHLTQMEDYRTLEMVHDAGRGMWVTEIPGEFVVPEWDLICFVEAMDKKGNGGMYPDLDRETPYRIVKLDRR